MHKLKTIWVNGRERELDYQRLTYDELCMLAHGPGSLPGVATITFFRGPKSKPEGSLQAGESVRLKNGMSFTVVHTNRA